MWRPRVLQIKITENSTAELQSATRTRKEEGAGGEGGRNKEQNEREKGIERGEDR